MLIKDFPEGGIRVPLSDEWRETNTVQGMKKRAKKNHVEKEVEEREISFVGAVRIAGKVVT